LDNFDLDSDYSPELIFSLDGQGDIQEMIDLINTQKFIWETYKILLDFTKTNSKLLNLYSHILKSAFTFCRENNRKAEFKRLCDSVRGYLQTLMKTEKKMNFQNKVQFSRPEVLKNLIQIRINLLDNATHLEQWQEAFKTAEDTVFLMEKYEKQSFDNSPSNNVMSNKKNVKTFKM
jgi:translation initiation factor 3 subunit A